MSEITYEKTASGWEVSTTGAGGVCFFMGWDRLGVHIGSDRPTTPELSTNERIVAVKPQQNGLMIYIEIDHE